MKVLLITSLYPSFVGQSRQEKSYAIHYFASDWVQQGHDVTVVNVTPIYPILLNMFKKSREANKLKKQTSFFIDDVKVNRVPIKKLPKINYHSKDIGQTYLYIKKLIDHNNLPDIIVCHMMNPSLYLANQLKNEFEVPLAFTLHQTDIHYLRNDNTKQLYFNKIHPNIDQINFRSVSLKKNYEEIGYPAINPFVAYSGIEENIIINSNKLSKKVNRQSKIIFVAASMLKLKNIDILIRAFSKVSVTNEVKLKIAGDGPEKEHLLTLVKEKNIENKVDFLGYLERNEVLKNMEEADVFAMVSSPETFGLVYLEAMAKGCITIGTFGEGIDGVIRDGENGYLCKPRDVGDLTAKLEKSLRSVDKSKIISNAVKTAKKMTRGKMSENYLNRLSELI